MAWYDNPALAWIPSAGIYDISVPLIRGTTITSPVNGVVVGGDYTPSGLYAAYGRHDWGGEVDILTNLQGYGEVIVNLLHFDTLNVVPGQQVSAGQVLGTSGGQLSGGNWPVYNPPGKTYSQGPHIGLGVRTPFAFAPAYDPTSLLSNLRAGTVSSSAPAGFGNGATGSSAPSPYNPIGQGIGAGVPAVGQLVGGALSNYNPAKLVQALEQDLLGYSIRGGLVVFGALLILVGVLVFYFTHAGVEVQELAGSAIPGGGQGAGQAGEASEGAGAAAAAA